MPANQAKTSSKKLSNFTTQLVRMQLTRTSLVRSSTLTIKNH
jgi:hypothetical protein